ncbi:MAG: hypothetical protein U1D30_11355 [Planctomycetota bacterium]
MIYGDEDNDVIYADGSKGSKTAMDTVHGGAATILSSATRTAMVAKGPAMA